METYRYYTLPYCQEHTTELDSEDESGEESREMTSVKGDRKGGARFKQRLGETVAGDHKETSPYEITFLDKVCTHPSRCGRRFRADITVNIYYLRHFYFLFFFFRLNFVPYALST
jgi:hypothetical protein